MREIKTLRESKRLTQKQVADILNISKYYISKIENNKMLPSLQLAVKFADLYSVQITTILKKVGFAVKEKHIVIFRKKDGLLAASITDENIVLDDDYTADVEFI